jgi:hypothetical protein
MEIAADTTEFMECMCHRLADVPIVNKMRSHSSSARLPLPARGIGKGCYQRIGNLRALVTGTSPVSGQLEFMMKPMWVGDIRSMTPTTRAVVDIVDQAVLFMKWFDTSTLPSCPTRNLQDSFIIEYKLSQKNVPDGITYPSNIVITFVYNVYHHRGSPSGIPAPVGGLQYFQLCKMYRFVLGLPDVVSLDCIIIKYVRFHGDNKRIVCCITDTMEAPEVGRFTTSVDTENVHEDTVMVYSESDGLYQDYIRHSLAINVYLHIRIVYNVSIDVRGKNEDESSLYIQVGLRGIIFGGLFTGHLVDTYGLTLNEYSR